jgi:antitoxin ParD1/3/4/toxin ParE1/3/4
MGRFLLTGPAKADIREIVAYVRERNPSAAPKVRQNLQQAMRRLADFPGIGHVRNDLSDESLRVWAVYSYLIVYRPDTRPLQVLRIVHGARDLKRLPLE